MTDIALDSWTQQLDQLKDRYKHVRQPILVALNILLHDQNIAIDDAKAQAQLHGVRITAASMNAARTLLSRMDAPPTPSATTPAAAPARRPRRERRQTEPLDVEGSIMHFVEKLRGESGAEAQRMREAVRQAVAILQAAIG